MSRPDPHGAEPHGADPHGADPFGTGALRAGVLAAWASSPTRFREDANAEEDLVLGGYADRLLVELAQNAADAAARAGVPGRLSVSLRDGELRAANTGEPLDAAGVASLASLRASAKRDGTGVGRFGVGFAAVLGVSDEPRVVATTGGVGFSAAATAAAIRADAGLGAELGAELDRRGGRPPVLRLVWPVDVPDAPPPEFATEVRLPLRPGVDGAALLAACAEQAADLLLALPWLQRIDVGDRSVLREDGDPVVIVDGGDRYRWRLARRDGRFDADALAGLGVERRRDWTVCWALPVDAAGLPAPLGPDVLHAPTRTDERLTLPARLIATLPVEASRRRVVTGAATDVVLDAAARLFPELVAGLAAPARTALVPAAGFPASDLDAALRERLLAALRAARWLPAVDGAAPLAPAAATVLDTPSPELAAVLAGVVDGLVDAELAAPRHATALAALEVPRLRAADVSAAVAGLARPPGWWHRLYAALAPVVDTDRAAAEELGALPVPLVDGRTVTGPRGVLLGDVRLPAVPTGELRLVHPDAAHPLLERLGARRVDAAGLLDALRPAVERSVADAEAGLDVAGLADAVLALVGVASGARPWLGALALPGADGEPRRGDELLLPDAALRALLAPDTPLGVLDAAVAAAHPREALRTVGVLDGFAVLDEPDPTGPDHDLDDEDGWWSAVDAAAEPPRRLLAVRDLDLVDDAAWPAALRLLTAEPATLAALREPGGYTGWWLARHARLGGYPPSYWRLPDAAALAGLYDPVPDHGMAPDVLAAAGVRAALAVDGPDDAAELLDRLADPRRELSAATARAAHAALVAAGLDADDVDPPQRVRAVTGTVRDADDALVLDRQWLAEVLDPDTLVAGGDPVALADLLDLPLASETVRGAVVSTGREVAWTTLPEVVAACETLGRPVPEGTLELHERLRVRVDGVEHAVACWVDDDGRIHAADPLRALLAAAPPVRA